MPDSPTDSNVPFLPKEHEGVLAAYDDYQTTRSRRLRIVTVALISALVSVVVTIIVNNILPLTFTSSNKNPLRQEVLPLLDLPPLGNVLRTYMGAPSLYGKDLNSTRDAWMSLFPPGMGYVSLDYIENAGEVPTIYQQMSNDGSGRFSVAAFHQLHCLFLIYMDLRRAMDGQFGYADGHTLHGSHSLHCVDYLRESITCTADSALEPFRSPFDGDGGTQGNGVDGFGSVHQCRDWEKLFEWSARFRYTDGHDAESFEG